jgi:alkanesulfonate monooxygenase SsuD/methylene tetrahydromethanopterin reductase-like flavin-dependent oxidoreductase (luciferase family)
VSDVVKRAGRHLLGLPSGPPPPPLLEDRLRDLAARWRAQSRHPQNRFRPQESALLAKHADELLAELREGTA